MDELTTLSATLENYLEAISRLIVEKGAARARDIADALAVHKSTVTAALKSLAERDLINYAPYEYATLTPQGQRIAQRIVHRHEVISRFLTDVLLVDQDAADANACRMEHVLDKEVLERLRLFAEFVKECPRTGGDWLEKFRSYFEHGGQRQGDESTAKEWVENFKQTLRQREKTGNKEKTMATLDELQPGQKATIRRVGGRGAAKRRIVDMGVVRGTPVEVVKVAPLGDPIEVKLKGYSLTLRKEEAATIAVEPL